MTRTDTLVPIYVYLANDPFKIPMNLKSPGVRSSLRWRSVASLVVLSLLTTCFLLYNITSRHLRFSKHSDVTTAFTIKPGVKPIIVLLTPFRNREAHLAQLVPHLENYWTDKDHELQVWVINQANDYYFNKGFVFNAGFFMLPNKENIKCVIMHDVDMIALAGVDYTSCALPTQLTGELDKWGWSHRDDWYNGGVINMSPSHWLATNGFSLKYVGWGGEDDELYWRLRWADLMNPETGYITRPPLGQGRFQVIEGLHHTARNKSHLHSSMDCMLDWSRYVSDTKLKGYFESDGISSVDRSGAGTAPGKEPFSVVKHEVIQREGFKLHRVDVTFANNAEDQIWCVPLPNYT
jgi:hypothetical protein